MSMPRRCQIPVLVREDGTLSLHAAERCRRHRPRHHPCHSRRGPRRQYRAADPAVRGAGQQQRPPSAIIASWSAPRARRCPSATGRLSIEGLREEGIEPLARGELRRRPSARPTPSRRMQISTSSCDAFDFAKLSRAPARFDPAELRALNAKLLHMLPFDAVAARLRAIGVGGGEAFWAGGARQSRRAWRCENLVGGGAGSVAAGHL